MGTPEPIYGPDALHSVAEQTKETPWTELKKDDMKWSAMEESCVETQTFYLNSNKGQLAMLQVIYSVIRWGFSFFPFSHVPLLGLQQLRKCHFGLCVHYYPIQPDHMLTSCRIREQSTHGANLSMECQDFLSQQELSLLEFLPNRRVHV